MNGDGNRNSTQPTRKWNRQIFFSFGGGGRVGRVVVVVGCLLLPTYSHQVLNMFLKFPIATHFVPYALPTVVLLKLPNIDR
jgi:hypothetical protein